MKTIIAGSRGIHEMRFVDQAVRDSGFNITEVVTGVAQGVDTLGILWGDLHRIPVTKFPANWSKHGKSAGAIRNQEMADYAQALISIHHSTPGSLDMIQRAKKGGLKIFEFVLDRYKNPLAMISQEPIVFASDMPLCDCCGQPWCDVHQEHYADCHCIGPCNAEELGYEVVEVGEKLYGVKKKEAK